MEAENYVPEEGAECRICRCEGDEERPLFYPCACTGSIKWCHESCLVEWIKVSRTRERCETCGTTLVFKPLYSESTPAVLPPSELTWLGIKKVIKGIPQFLRSALVVAIWLVLVPVWSAAVFNYIRPNDQVEDQPISWFDWVISRANPLSFSTWETGVWIIVTGFFSLFMLISVYDFVRGFEMGEFAGELEILRQRAQEARDRQEANLPARNQEQVAQNQPEVVRVPENRAADAGVEARRIHQPNINRAQPLQPPNEDRGHWLLPPRRPALPPNEQHDDLDMNNEEPDNRNNDFFDAADDQVGGNNNNNQNNNDVMDDLAGDQIGLDEWVGLRGPWCHLVNNVICLCLCILVFLLAFYALPENIGRSVFRETTKVAIPLQQSISSMLKDPLQLSLPPAIIDAINHIQSVSHSRYDTGTCLNPSAFTSKFPASLDLHRLHHNEIIKMNDKLKICDAEHITRSARRLDMYKLETLSVITGLIAFMFVVQIQFQVCAWSWRSFVQQALRPTFPLRGMPHYLWKSVLRTTRTIVRVQKVILLLVFKMIAFPIALGMLISSSLRPLLPISEEDYLLFTVDHPHLAVLVFWVSGITHTLLVTMNVILVRDILHPDVLDGVIRMRDPHGNQFLPLLVEPMAQQTKRTIITCMIYTVIVLLFVSLPSLVAQYVGITIPLTTKFISVGLQLPVELALFHMWMLHTLAQYKPMMVSAQTWFLRTGCNILGLNEFLLPVPINAAEYSEALKQARNQAGELHWLDASPRVSRRYMRSRIRPSFAYLRVLVLLIAAWCTWMTASLMAIFGPFLIGRAALMSLPALPNWVQTDIRLYAIGWMLLRATFIYIPIAHEYLNRSLDTITWNNKDIIAFLFSAGFFAFSLPVVFGIFVFLATAFSDPDFPSEKYVILNDTLELTGLFALDILHRIPLARAWVAGLPFLMLFSKTIFGRRFWESVINGQWLLAGKVALQVLAIGISCLVMGLYIGIQFWRSVNSSFSSPLYFVRFSVLLCVVGSLTPVYATKYQESIRAAFFRFHDSLKDEKYLMGRKLRNYDARV